MPPVKKNSISQSTTQLFLDLYDITNDLIILGDGAASLVITVSAMNFGLLSENEQDATIYAYAALLNSLSFPVEIVIRSQPKDVTGYLKRIQDQEERTTNPIYKQKIKEYRTFVESLVQDQNVLDKKFYIVIPLTAVEMGLTTQSVVPGAKSKPISSFEKNYIIEKAKTNLIPRRDHLIDQLARIGLYSRQLNTQELIQMLYSSYNPESFEGQKVTDTSNYTTPLVQAKIQGDFMTDMPAVTTAPQPPQPPVSPQTPTPTTPIPVQATLQEPTSTVIPTAPSLNVVEPTAPAMPEFSKSDLGFTTPPQMSAEAPAVAPALPTPPMPSQITTPVTPAEPVTPVTQPQSPSVTPVFQSTSSPLAESPIVSVPEPSPSPAINIQTPAPVDTVNDPQAMINQTISQLNSTPSTTTTETTPTISVTPSPTSSTPNIATPTGDLPLPTNPMNQQ